MFITKYDKVYQILIAAYPTPISYHNFNMISSSLAKSTIRIFNDFPVFLFVELKVNGSSI